MRLFVLAIFAACDAPWRGLREYLAQKGNACDRQGKSIAQAMTCALAEPAVAVIA